MASRNHRVGLIVTLAAGLALDHGPAPARDTSAAPLQPALAALDAADFLRHVEVLSSDEFEGRSPGTHGEAMTVAYLEQQFKALGLQPGNPDGSYVQAVPMTGFVAKPRATFQVRGQSVALRYPDDFVAFSLQRRPRVRIERSQLVFVGYGVQAPEYRWDDFKGMDVRGKTLVMLINDPPIPDPLDPGKLDARMFGGKAMTYYGRWTYKYETAAKLGAAAAIIVHETGPAAYPYSVVVNSWGGENFELDTGQASTDVPRVAAWMTLEQAEALFRASGMNFESMKQAAISRDFRPIALDASVSFDIDNRWRDVVSQNVIARLEGSDPRLRHQYVVYSAHWDHFGWDPKLPGDKHAQIYHGAHDNASGIAALLALARAFKALPHPPRRTILFIATTAEERGLLGARYYARHPLYPLRATLADINMDGIASWGRTRDIELVTSGKSSVDDIVRAEAADMGMQTLDDSHPERGSFYRADQLEFARVGIPVVFLGSGKQVIGKPAGYGDERTDQYIAHDYHQVTDTIKPDWDPAGAAQEIQLLLRVGYALAQGREFPRWRPDAEFKAARDAMLAAPATVR